MAQQASESLFGLQHENVRYELTVQIKKDKTEDASPDVASFRATESLSQPFTYRIVGAIDPDDVANFETALGREARFVIKHDEKVVRVVHGIITDVMPDGIFVGKTRFRIVFVLEPRMANLRYSGGFRIFQNKDIREIVTEICKAEQIACEWRPFPAPVKHEYCTQLDESDLSFVTRIASEEGMHFFFEHTEEKTTVVFTNDLRGYHEIEDELTVPFNDAVGAVTGEHVRSIRRVQSVRTGAFEHRDYDPLPQPKLEGARLFGRKETDGEETPANSHQREVRDYPGRFIDPEMGKALAVRRLEELRSDAFSLGGTASSLRFTVGRSFTLEGHRENGFNRKLVLTYIRMEGVVQGASQEGGFLATTGLTTFTAVPAQVPIHPRRRPKPSSRLQSARVVGPTKNDPNVDDHGRVKVQFFWDRDGKFDDDSSCWIRMMTPVAHADEGFYQAHKVGSEVLVDFIDGDIDRPIVLGAVYNHGQPQPMALKGQVAKSTWKTRSIPGNEGYNELTQDNTAGKEEIFVHAQRDLREVVLHDHTESIGANQTSSVGANQSITVGANRTLSVGANETTTIKGHRKEKVDTGEDVTINSGRTHAITGDDNLAVFSGGRNVNVEQEDTLVANSKVDTIKKHLVVSAGERIWLQETGGDGAEVRLEPGVISVTTKQKISVWTPFANVTLAENKISLQCGKASITLSGDGTIELTGSQKIHASVGGSSLTLEPAQATLNGGAMTKVVGAEVDLNA